MSGIWIMKAGPPCQRPLYYYYYRCSPVAFKSHSYAWRVIFSFLRRKIKKQSLDGPYIIVWKWNAGRWKKNRMEKSKVLTQWVTMDNVLRGSLLTPELWIKKSRTRTCYFLRNGFEFLFVPAFGRVRKICLKCIFCENS